MDSAHFMQFVEAMGRDDPGGAFEDAGGTDHSTRGT